MCVSFGHGSVPFYESHLKDSMALMWLIVMAVLVAFTIYVGDAVMRIRGDVKVILNAVIKIRSIVDMEDDEAVITRHDEEHDDVQHHEKQGRRGKKHKNTSESFEVIGTEPVASGKNGTVDPVTGEATDVEKFQEWRAEA